MFYLCETIVLTSKSIMKAYGRNTPLYNFQHVRKRHSENIYKQFKASHSSPIFRDKDKTKIP